MLENVHKLKYATKQRSATQPKWGNNSFPGKLDNCQKSALLLKYIAERRRGMEASGRKKGLLKGAKNPCFILDFTATHQPVMRPRAQNAILHWHLNQSRSPWLGGRKQQIFYHVREWPTINVFNWNVHQNNRPVMQPSGRKHRLF